jgi:RNA polymerase sigma factor (sigma-70 family)
MAEADPPVRGIDPPVELVDFCREQYPAVLGSIRLLVGSDQRAEELAQEAFIRVCERWVEVSAMERPGGWVQRVGVNLALSDLRRSRSEGRALARWFHRERVDVAAAPVFDGTASELRRAVERLPVDERAVIVVRYFLGCSVRETADLLHLPEGTVKTRTRRALGSMRAAHLIPEVTDVNDA